MSDFAKVPCQLACFYVIIIVIILKIKILFLKAIFHKIFEIPTQGKWVS